MEKNSQKLNKPKKGLKAGKMGQKKDNITSTIQLNQNIYNESKWGCTIILENHKSNFWKTISHEL